MLFTIWFLVYLSTLYLTRCDVSETVRKRPENQIKSNATSEDVTETQHASCKIATDKLVADARATVTRVLTGACSAKTMDARFENLEKNLTEQLKEIKMLLRAILREKSDSVEYTKLEPYEIFTPRNEEIVKFNNTVREISLINGSTKAFIYYWQVKDLEEKLLSWSTARSQRSSTFYVGQVGYAMYIRITPKYFPDGTVFVGVGLTRGRYDSLLPWPFLYKIRLEVLDQSAEDETRQDRRSRIWDPSSLCSEYFWGRPKLTGEPDNPECVGLSIPRQVLSSKFSSLIDHPISGARYLWNGGIIIKLTIYF